LNDVTNTFVLLAHGF